MARISSDSGFTPIIDPQALDFLDSDQPTNTDHITTRDRNPISPDDTGARTPRQLTQMVNRPPIRLASGIHHQGVKRFLRQPDAASNPAASNPAARLGSLNATLVTPTDLLEIFELDSGTTPDPIDEFLEALTLPPTQSRPLTERQTASIISLVWQAISFMQNLNDDAPLRAALTDYFTQAGIPQFGKYFELPHRSNSQAILNSLANGYPPGSRDQFILTEAAKLQADAAPQPLNVLHLAADLLRTSLLDLPPNDARRVEMNVAADLVDVISNARAAYQPHTDNIDVYFKLASDAATALQPLTRSTVPSYVASGVTIASNVRATLATRGPRDAIFTGLGLTLHAVGSRISGREGKILDGVGGFFSGLGSGNVLTMVLGLNSLLHAIFDAPTSAPIDNAHPFQSATLGKFEFSPIVMPINPFDVPKPIGPADDADNVNPVDDSIRVLPWPDLIPTIAKPDSRGR